MSFFDSLYSIGAVRKLLWRMWYPLLTRQLRGEEVLLLNYAFETEPPMGITLSPDDEPHRTCIQLYHHVATQVELRGKSVLEVSCGHGGGASYLARTLRPSRYVGLDLNPAGIKFCQKRHQVDGLSFIRGDAQKLPFDDNTFDAVINIEASHCYPDLPAFLVEVARVLRPGGHLLYADFRFEEEGNGRDFAEWDRALAAAPLSLVQSRVINAEVRRGMDQNAARSERLIASHLPRFLHGVGRDFAGVPGSRVYNALARGEFSYRSYCFSKPRTTASSP